MPIERVLNHRMRDQARYWNNVRDPDPAYAAAYLRLTCDGLAATGMVGLDTMTHLYRLGLGDEVFEMIAQASFDYAFDAQRPWPNGAISPAAIFSVTHNTPLMRDRRFVGLCAKLGLSEYWLAADRWPYCAQQAPTTSRPRPDGWRQPSQWLSRRPLGSSLPSGLIAESGPSQLRL